MILPRTGGVWQSDDIKFNPGRDSARRERRIPTPPPGSLVEHCRGESSHRSRGLQEEPSPQRRVRFHLKLEGEAHVPGRG